MNVPPTASDDPVALELDGDETASVLAGQADIVDAVLAANRVFVAVAANALAGVEHEVTMPQFRALVLINMHESMTVAHLADALGVVPSTATRMCDRLIGKQLLDRSTDSMNRRQVILTLRPEGRALIEASTAQRTTEINALLAAIPVELQAQLATSLTLLVQAAHASDRTRDSRPLPPTKAAPGTREKTR
ncbi:MarR family transcriptional regulator [Dermatophilaceae bacterium Sec6.4]